MLKVGFDIHGVIDTNPRYFASIINRYRAKGHEVHIITGSPLIEMANKLYGWGILYDGYFSIAEWCLEHSKTSTVRSDGQVFDSDEIWNNAKAMYCMREGIDIHVDDSIIYQPTFKNISTRFFLYDDNKPGIRIEMKQVIASANDNCEHFPCTKGCPQYILYRDKVKNVIFKSKLYELWEDSITDTSIVDDLVESIFEEMG